MADQLPLPVETVSDPHWADAWLYAVIGDSRFSPGIKNIAALLRLHLNVPSWTASPSIEGLAARSCQTTRAVEKQRDALAAAGLIAWQPNRGRVRNEYRLIVTPNVRRELARIYPEHTAVIEGANPEPTAGVETANPERANGVEKTQPRTLIRATPNGRPLNPEPTAGQTRKPVKPVSGSAPLAPEGATVAAVEDVDPRLIKACGGHLHWSLKGAMVLSEHPPVIGVGRPSAANWARSNFAFELERQWGGQAVEVRILDHKAAANAA